MTTDDERIALFLDYENLAIGAREDLGGAQFDLKPVADALAERGRVVVRRAYADWSYFDEDRRMLTKQHVELIEIPQRLGAVRKNAADIKMAVDAIELCFERDYITTYVICTGDSDFTPLVAKLRELNRRVIGVGMQASTSKLLPPACDEFLFYERMEGVDLPRPKRSSGRRGRGGNGKASGGRPAPRVQPEPAPEPQPEVDTESDGSEVVSTGDENELVKVVTQTLSGLQRSSGGAVLASTLKRAILRKDPTFSEADWGFRAFGEMLRHLEQRNVVELTQGSSRGDPEVSFAQSSGEDAAFDLLRSVVADAAAAEGPPPLSGLKDRLRKRQPSFSEKEFGFGGFLQFCKAARTRGIVTMEWNEDADDYVLDTPEATDGPPAG
jgi:uncharacterized protein (TIGR00288 family)